MTDHAHRTSNVGAALAGGMIAAIWAAALTLAYAGLIFSGSGPAALQIGVTALLVGFGLLAVLLASASGVSGVAASTFGATAVVQAAAIQAVDGYLAGNGIVDGDARAWALVISGGAITCATGAALAAFGLFKIGSLVRLLPHPVSQGFFCGLGAAIAAGGIAFAAGVTPSLANLPKFAEPRILLQLGACASVALLLVVLPLRIGHWAVLPVVLLVAVLAYHGVRVATGQSIAEAQAAGWLLGPFPGAGGTPLPPVAAFAALDASLIPVLLPYLASAVLLSAITVALMVTGIEAVTGQAQDVDREMAVNGFANMAVGVAGGLPGGHGLAATVLLARFSPGSRLAALVPGIVALVLAALGHGVLEVLPRPVLAALLLALGAEWTLIRTWRAARPLSVGEATILLIVAAGFIALGLLEGLALGLGLALLIFIWTYRRIPVVRSVVRGDEMRSSVLRPHAALEILRQKGSRIQLIRLQGYMFFLNAQSVLAAFAHGVKGGADVVILDFAHVSGMDSSAAEVFRRIEQQARHDGVRLVPCAVPEALRSMLARHGVMPEERLVRVASADRAIELAEETILAGHGQAAEAMPTTLVQFLAQFGDVAEAERRLAPFLARVAYAPGETLMRQGEPATDMIFLEVGRAVATLHDPVSEDPGRGPVHLRTMQAGSLLGEVALMRGGARTASVIAETACIGQRLTRASLARMDAEDPALALVLQRAILVQLADRLADNARAVELALR